MKKKLVVIVLALLVVIMGGYIAFISMGYEVSEKKEVVEVIGDGVVTDAEPDDTIVAGELTEPDIVEPEDASISTGQGSGTVVLQNVQAFQNVSTNGSEVVSKQSEEALEAIEFLKYYYTEYLRVQSYGYATLNEDEMPDSYSEFIIAEKKQWSDGENYYKMRIDEDKFYEAFASKDCNLDSYQLSAELITTYPTNLEQTQKMSALGATLKEFDYIKVLSGGDGIYKIGVIFTANAEHISNWGEFYDFPYYGTATVILEKGEWKIEDTTTYFPYSIYDDEEDLKTMAFLANFKAKLSGSAIAKDVPVEGKVIEEYIELDEDEADGIIKDNGFAVQDKTLKDIINENDPKVVTILGDTSQGSGVFIAPGIIVTNAHVINGQSECAIRTVDGEVYPIDGVIGYNPALDLAILKMSDQIGDAVKLGDPDAMSKGDNVVAIGSPLGYYNTVTTGIHANKIYDADIRVLQNSLPLAPGNSGGGLFNENGELIGINTAIAEGYADISFAVSVYHLVDIVEELKTVKFNELEYITLSELFSEQ